MINIVELFLHLLKGSYAYLLIIQVIVVAGLLLSFLWLLIKRIREANPSMELVPALSVPVDVPAPVPVVGDSQPNPELLSRIQALETENGRLKEAEEAAKLLRDKVQYLESKLLEYEILQEEIGTLSALKLENEYLKEELSHQKDPPAPTGRSAAPKAPSPTERSAEPEKKSFEPAPPSVPPDSIFVSPPAAGDKDTDLFKQAELATSGVQQLLQEIDSMTRHDKG